jgi:2-polyprenyl-3-methyl-5-hydroxy-6-metoxy-1,4-benzoquinol methylase
MSGSWWTIQYAPQMEICIKDESTSRGWEFVPIAGCPGFAKLRSASSNPALECPFIRRQWRHDFCWPGALTVGDFLSRASAGLIERFRQRIVPGCEITVTTSFRDRSHLGSRLRQLLMREFQKSTGDSTESNQSKFIVPSQFQNGEHEKLGLHVLLTPKALTASCLIPSESGVTDNSFATSDESIAASRAANKIRQALAQAQALGVLLTPPAQKSNRSESTKPIRKPNPPHSPLSGQLWLDLGASPGGITEALFQLGGRVIAIDRAPLDSRLCGIPEIIFLQENAVEASVSRITQAAKSAQLDGVVCDMNGPPQIAAHSVRRLASLLKPGGLVVFTLKLLSVSDWSKMLHSVVSILCTNTGQPKTIDEKSANPSVSHQSAPLSYIGAYHLQQNRDELTLLFRFPVQ